MKRRNQKVYSAFLDIWAAYDSVDRNILWEKVRRRGTPERVIRMLARMFRNAEIVVVADGIRSRKFTSRAGVPQGSPISPHLYNVLIDELFYLLEQTGAQIQSGTVKTADGEVGIGLAFADDIAIIAANPVVLRQCLKICEDYSRLVGFRWKPSKSEVVTSTAETFTLYGVALARKHSFAYLGVPVTTDGIDAKALADKNKSRMLAASDSMAALGMHGKGLPFTVTIRAWKSFIRSCLEYGLAIVDWNPDSVKELEKTQLQTIRKLLGGFRCTSRSAMRLLAEAQPIGCRIGELQYRWLVRVFQNPTLGLRKVWLSDGLNDKQSTIRHIMDRNRLWKAEMRSRGQPRFGRALQSLWSDQEVAAFRFRGQWNGRVPRNSTQPFAALEDINVDTKLILDTRSANYNQWLEKACDSGKEVIARDIPLLPGRKSPLRLVRGSVAFRRLMVDWWLGAYPRGDDRGKSCLEQVIFSRSMLLNVCQCLAQSWDYLQTTNGDGGITKREKGCLIVIIQLQMHFGSEHASNPWVNTIFGGR